MDWITLVDVPQAIVAPAGVVYSCRPRLAGATDSHEYFIKGPEPAVIFAEVVGYSLAGLAGLDVPRFGLWRHPHTGDVYFASRSARLRSFADELLHSRNVANPGFLATCVAVDIWVANPAGGFDDSDT